MIVANDDAEIGSNALKEGTWLVQCIISFWLGDVVLTERRTLVEETKSVWRHPASQYI